MELQNVEKIRQPMKKSWFARNCPTFAAAAAGVTALAVSSASNAFLQAADVTSATGSAGGEEVLKTAGIWVLTIAVGIAVVYKIVRLVQK